MKLVKVSLVALLVASSAYAAPPKLDTLILPLTGEGAGKDGVVPAGTHQPRVFVGVGGIGTNTGESAYPENDDMGRVWKGKVLSKLVAFASDKKAAWITADLRLDAAGVCGAPECAKTKSPSSSAHVTLLVEEGTPWQPLLIHVAQPATEKEAATNGTPTAIDRKIDADAEDVAKLFESTIGDPAAFAGTVSARKEAVLYGSRKAEKFVGGTAMKAAWKKWNLKLKVRDGVQAGITHSKDLAWVAANVDATPANSADAKPTPYCATFVYEKTPKGWQLVVAQFSAFYPTI